MSDYPQPILTVDVVLLTLRDDTLHVGLIRRDAAPFENLLSLPGGYVHVDGDADTRATAERVLRYKAGVQGIYLDQLAVFSGPDRDPRGWSATVVYFALLPAGAMQVASAPGLTWTSARKAQGLAFDHGRIVAAAVDLLRQRGAYSTLPALLLPETFTFPQLRHIYEEALGVELNDSSFRRKIEDMGIIERVAGQKDKSSARPAQLYRLRKTSLQDFDRRV